MIAGLRYDAVILLILIQQCCLLPCDSLMTFGGRLPIGEALAFSDSLGSVAKFNRRTRLERSTLMEIGEVSFSGSRRTVPITTAAISSRIVEKMPLAHHIGDGGGIAVTTVGGGLLAGMLHAISGPDHLAALLPRVIGKMGITSMWIGAVWGLGHSISASMIVLAAFFFKDRLQVGLIQASLLDRLNLWTGGLIGLSLIAIGAMGLHENFADAHSHSRVREVKVVDSGIGSSSCYFTDSSSLLDKESTPPIVGGGGVSAGSRTTVALKAIFLNGLLHGFNWDGAPSLIPALACTGWSGVCSFLFAYCSGTILAMCAATATIGEGSSRVNKAFGSPDFVQKLSMASSFLAIVVGFVFILQNVFFTRIQTL